MLSLPSLKEARAQKSDAIRAIVAKATTENRDLSEQEQSAFEAGKKDIEKLEKDIGNAEFLADMERRMEGQPVGDKDQKFDTECRSFSLLKAIALQSGLHVDAGREIEISQELSRRNGPGQGILVPTAIFEKRVMTTLLPGGGPGSNIIPTDYRPDMYIDILRSKIVCQRMGARVLSDLVGNLAIPRKTKSATSGWVAENAPLSPSDMEHGQLTMSPKHVGCLSEFSRNMLLQSSPDVEALARDDFAADLATAVDLGALVGGGTNEPVGVLSTVGIGDVAGGIAGLAPTWQNIVSLIAMVNTNNALDGALGFVGNAKTSGKMASVLKSTADTASNFIMSDPGADRLAGYPFGQTNLVPSNLVKGGSGAVASALIFGDWSQLLIGYWSSFDLLVNPYDSVAYPKGNILVRGMLTCDVAVRQPKAFAAIKDILTT
jgi:HK97 family phage major capsid protein